MERLHYLKLNAKFAIINKTVTARKGDTYEVPLPGVQKRLGGLDLHLSKHRDGSTHWKSRKANLWLRGTSWMDGAFASLMETCEVEDIPPCSEGIIADAGWFLSVCNACEKETPAMSYFDGDQLREEMSKQTSIAPGELANVTSWKDRIALFFTGDYWYATNVQHTIRLRMDKLKFLELLNESTKPQ
ncbi:hypothetical protein HY493_04880 [Candidatus Woesearchaeota archaeon]|nr:hypothetical protein [Candidatus Woesearchaeota archaeon]